jgi:hypothetical protein
MFGAQETVLLIAEQPTVVEVVLRVMHDVFPFSPNPCRRKNGQVSTARRDHREIDFTLGRSMV